MPVAPAQTSCVLDRLKTETRPEHKLVEGVLDLLREDLYLAHYRQVLERYCAFYAPVEAQLAAVFATARLELDYEARRKLPQLQVDLQVLGGPAAGTLPVFTALPPLGTPHQALGCLYVLEGATLGGGQAPRIAARLHPAQRRRCRAAQRAFADAIAPQISEQ